MSYPSGVNLLNCEERTIYPSAGRMLTEADVGKQVIRLLHTTKGTAGCDWGYCYYKGADIEKTAGKLEKISGKVLTVNSDCFATNRFNDGYWTTTEELRKYLKQDNIEANRALFEKITDE